MPKCSQCKTTREKEELKYIQLKPVCKLEVNDACIPKLGLYLVARDRQKQEKAFRKDTRERKAKLDDTVSNWTKKAQKAFNWYIRERDHGLACISCGRNEHEFTGFSPRGGIWDCGHYRSVGSCPELRFEEDNAHKQCKVCNSHLSGNHVEYRFGLLARIGGSRLAVIEGPHEKKRYRVDELKEIAKNFNRLARELKRKREVAD